MTEDITIILSTYNEKASIEITIKELIKHINNVEIVVVDDNSPDGTLEILKNIGYPKLKIFSRKKTKGLASAFLLGLINSQGSIIGWVDSNMGSVVKKFPEMIFGLENADIVLLSRYVAGGKDDRSTIRVLSSRAINGFAKFILRSKIQDLSSGIFVMKRKVLLDVVPIASGHGEFMVEFLHHAEIKRNKIKEIPYTHRIDIEGNSKTFASTPKFLIFGFFYVLRLFQTIFRR